MNTNLTFFSFYKSKQILPEIENKYVNPTIQKLIDEREKIYLSNVEKRKRKIANYTSRLDENECFRKCTYLALIALSAGVHMSIYYIMKASGVSSSTSITFLATMPATIMVMACFSPFATHYLSKAMAHCAAPRVRNEPIDLEKELADIESNHQRGFLSV